jgi:long-chain acyl-CoA synthetase
LTYADLDAASDGLALGLLKDGFGPGDRLASYLQNVPEFEIALLACWKAGGIFVPLNPMLKAQELQYHLSDSGATVLIADPDLYAQHGTETSVKKVLLTPELDAVIAEHAGNRPPAPELTQDDIAYLVYTSGTTGRPKGAMNLHSNVAFSATVLRTWMDLGPGDVVLGGAPLFHITGLVCGIAAAHAAAVPLVLFGRFDAGNCLEAIERHRATFTVMAITAFLALLAHPDLGRHDVRSLSKAFSGGAPVAPAIVERWEAEIGSYIHNIYGLTETTSPSHITPLGTRSPTDPVLGALAVGIPAPSTWCRLVDSSGVEVGAGKEGEIQVRGPQVVPGYWNQPEASAAAFADGYLKTGDVGKRDERGYHYVVDRIKDMINASGFKVWPREVEDYLYQHPAVREAAVVGVPDEYRGETVKAFVSLRPDAIATEGELIAFCKERMAAYKYPRQVVILADLPKTPTGKVLRRELRELGTGL